MSRAAGHILPVLLALAAAAAKEQVAPTVACPNWPNSCEVRGVVKLPGNARASTGLKVLLNGGTNAGGAGGMEATVRRDGTFVFYEVVPGRYLLEVSSLDFFFSQIKLDVGHKFPGQIVCLEYRYPGARQQRFPYDAAQGGMVLMAQANPKGQVFSKQALYFEQRQQMSVMSIFQQPMMLMMLFTMGIMFCLPKMMDQMDPEEMKKMQEEMGSGDPSEAWSRLMGGAKKGADSDED